MMTSDVTVTPLAHFIDYCEISTVRLHFYLRWLAVVKRAPDRFGCANIFIDDLNRRLTVMRVSEVVVFIAAVFFLAITGCDKGQSKTGERTKADQPPGGRAETKTLQAADVVGYDGQHLRKSVDKVLDANDQQNKNLEDAIRKSDDR